MTFCQFLRFCLFLFIFKLHDFASSICPHRQAERWILVISGKDSTLPFVPPRSLAGAHTKCVTRRFSSVPKAVDKPSQPKG